MTAEDLITLLQTLPPDTLVMVDGYEWGIQLPDEPRLIHIDLNWSAEFGERASLGGPFDEADDMTKPLVLLLPR